MVTLQLTFTEAIKKKPESHQHVHAHPVEIIIFTLNLLLMLASSLLILLISASLLLQFLMSDMKTARPRMPSPRTAGIVISIYNVKLEITKK